jgi:hypothetical protein
MKAPFFPTSLLLVGLLVPGCAPTVALHTETESAAIRGAEEVGASKIPAAALYLHYAKEELDEAKNLYASGMKKQAECMLMRAQADAELAIAMTREATQRAEADAAVDRIRALRIENP